MAEPVQLKAPLEDISRDCQLGIDAKLDLYDLGQSQLIKTVPYVNKGLKMRLHVRFTDDCRHLVFIDRVDDTLHVVRMLRNKLPGKNQNDDFRFQTIASCLTHAPKMNFFGGLTLRQKGHVIVIRSATGEALIVLRLLDSEKKNKEQIQYGSEIERALSLVPDSKYASILVPSRKAE